MTTLLKRLSLNLERRVNNSLGDDASGPSRGLASTHSFNDFSMHINQEGRFDSVFAAIELANQP